MFAWIQAFIGSAGSQLNNMVDSSLNGKPEKLWVFDILKSLSGGWGLRKGLCGRLAPMKSGLKHLFV